MSLIFLIKPSSEGLSRLLLDPVWIVIVANSYKVGDTGEVTVPPEDMV